MLTAAEARGLTDARRAEDRIGRMIRTKVLPKVNEEADSGYWKAFVVLSISDAEAAGLALKSGTGEQVAARLRELGYTVEVGSNAWDQPTVEVSW